MEPGLKLGIRMARELSLYSPLILLAMVWLEFSTGAITGLGSGYGHWENSR